MELESEARADLLQVCATAVFCELVAVVTEENEVALIVEGDYSSPVEVRGLGEKSCEHTPDTVAGHGVEVV